MAHTQTKQLNLLKDIGFDAPSWEDLGYLLIGIVIAISLCGAAWTLWEKNRHDPWLRLLEAAQKRLARGGLKVVPNTPPRSLAQQLTSQRGQLAALSENSVQSIHDWLLRLEAVRYAPSHSPNADANANVSPYNLKRLQREFKYLAWPR